MLAASLFLKTKGHQPRYWLKLFFLGHKHEKIWHFLSCTYTSSGLTWGGTESRVYTAVFSSDHGVTPAINWESIEVDVWQCTCVPLNVMWCYLDSTRDIEKRSVISRKVNRNKIFGLLLCTGEGKTGYEGKEGGEKELKAKKSCAHTEVCDRHSRFANPVDRRNYSSAFVISW